MPTLLSDPPNTLLLVLAALVLVAGLVWLGRRDRRVFIAFVAVLLVAGLVVLLDQVFESPREEAVRRVKAMTTAADRRDADAFASHVAETMKYQGDGQPFTFTRDQLRKHAFWEMLRHLNAHVATWDFARADVKEIDDRTIEVGFLAKGETEGKQLPIYFRATFSRQADGQMKMTALDSFDPLQRTKRLSIPGFGTSSP